MAFYQPSETCQIGRLGALYEAVFGQRTDGTFVEVGAFDGDRYSNTSCLADVGWRGLYIEPVPLHVQACRQRHGANPGVTVLECAIGAAPGRLPIHVAQLFSSFHADAVEASKEVFRNLRADEALVQFHEIFTDQTVMVEVRRLDEVLTAQAIPPRFDVLVVDVEGHEVEVFDSFDLRLWAPRLIIVELLDLHSRYGKTAAGMAALRAKILSHGYAHLHVDEVNTVFERAD
ncbi:MAG: FkbM family methyltransferase [Proteobacteria bacterium]|nr:FkbM family methyltransferase [Pseudomonadota bacterium]